MSKIKITIIETFPALEELRTMLEGLGYTISGIFQEEDEAIKKIESLQPDLVLLSDNITANLSNKESVGEIVKALDIPIVYMKENKNNDDFFKEETGGAYDCIVKPVQPDALRSTIEISIFRHRNNRKIEENRSNFQRFLNNMPTSYQSLDEKECLIEVNPHWLSLLGYKHEEVIGHHFNEFFPSDKKEYYQTQFQKHKTDGELLGLEFELRKKDGSIVTVIMDGQISDTTKNRLEHIHCVLTDITAQAQSAKALKDAHYRMLAILNGIEAQIYVVDLDSHEILFMNDTMKKEYGGDFTGNNCWEIICDKKSPCPHCQLPPFIYSEKDFTDPIIWEQINSVTGKLYVNTDRVIKWIDGRLVKLQVARDVTEQRVLEEKLRHAQKMESIGTLAGGIAHDFNNILSAVIGFTELAFDDTEKGTAINENLEEVLTASHRARELVKQILGFARQTDGQIKPVRISALVEETLSLIRSSVPTTIKIEPHLNTNATIMADPSQLHQVFMNLCTNAAQAMEDEGGILKISLKEVVFTKQEIISQATFQPGKYFQILVADTGKGIPKKIIDSIFEPYFTTKASGEGTGMGLALVHGVIKSLNGEIFANSIEEEGTSFTIYLPFSKKERNNEITLQQNLTGGDERILLVDDELPIAKMTCQALDLLGYTSTYRTSGHEALNLFKNDPSHFDLVITDLTMPDMTGDVLAKELTALRLDIPIILCTGYSKRFFTTLVDKHLIKATLSKPISRQQMAKTVREVLDSSSG